MYLHNSTGTSSTIYPTPPLQVMFTCNHCDKGYPTFEDLLLHTRSISYVNIPKCSSGNEIGASVSTSNGATVGIQPRSSGGVPGIGCYANVPRESSANNCGGVTTSTHQRRAADVKPGPAHACRPAPSCRPALACRPAPACSPAPENDEEMFYSAKVILYHYRIGNDYMRSLFNRLDPQVIAHHTYLYLIMMLTVSISICIIRIFYNFNVNCLFNTIELYL